MIGDESDQVAADRAPRARGGEQPGRPLRALRPGRGRRRLGPRRGDARPPHRGRGRAPAQRHHPQHLARHRLRPLDQPLPRLRARLHLLLRPADATPTSASRPASTSRPGSSPSPRRPQVLRGRARPPRPTARRRSRSAPTPTPTSRSRSASASCAASSRCLRDFRHPVTVVTKGALVERDADILGEMGRAGPRPRRRLGDDARPQPSPAPWSRAPPAPERRLTAIRT